MPTVVHPLDRSAAVTTAAGTTGVVLGKLVASEPILVDYPGNPGGKPRPAPSMARVTAEDVGRTAVVSFLDGDAGRPVVLGLLQTGAGERAAPALETRVDGERVVLSGTKQVELRCGDASIVLTSDGKVTIRGVSVTSTAKRTNRIRGGSVQLN